MSAGSNNSNFGYGNLNPYVGSVSGAFVNKWSSNNPANFGSNEIPGLPGLSGSKNNVDAATGYVPGICFKGGSKKLKQKIKNITKKYMRGGKKNSLKRKISKFISRTLSRTKTGGKRKKHSKTHRDRHRRQRGGYSQYQNNYPNTPVYSVGGVLGPDNLGLANPPPIKLLPNCANCIDNYNHNTNYGFPSQGH